MQGRVVVVKTLVPYINFAGQCAEALALYCHCFDGRVVDRLTYADAPESVPEAVRDKIMHAEFVAESIRLMATDGMPGGCRPGDQVKLAVGIDDLDTQARIFDCLAEGGEVIMPLGDVFWNARFGEVVDRFGIHWMLNCPHRSSED
jgi:PhnB protein